MVTVETKIDALLNSYPRLSPPLSFEWQAAYEEVYKASRGGKSFLYRLTQGLEAWMHRKVASVKATDTLLEIGAGNLNHVCYEPNVRQYDIVEPFEALWKDQPGLLKISEIFSNIDQIPIGKSYDRIISIAALEHIDNLPFLIARSGLLLKKGGQFDAAIPSEGGFLWGFSWRASVGLSTRLRKGLCYGELMRHEHLSRADEIIDLVKYFFDECNIERFPISHPHLSLYTSIHACSPNLLRCGQYAG